MNSSADPGNTATTPADAVLAGEAGVAFQPSPAIDPITEWVA